MVEPRKVALFDMDGTLADYHKALKEDMERIAHPSELDKNGEMQFSSWDNHMPAYMKSRKHMITNQPGWWIDLHQLRLGFDVLSMCEFIGYEIMILTKAPYGRENAWTEKVKWCEKYVPGRQVTITTDKSLTYGRVLVDDYPDYATSWLRWRPRGLVIMPKSPACEGFSHENVVIFDGTNNQEVYDKLVEAFKRE